jgi:hypothetical protein
MYERTLVVLLQVQRGHRYRGAQTQVQGQPEDDVREDTGGTVTGTERAQVQVQGQTEEDAREDTDGTVTGPEGA